MNRYRYGEPGMRGRYLRFPFLDEDKVPPWDRDELRTLLMCGSSIAEHRPGCKDGSVTELAGTYWPWCHDPSTFLRCKGCGCCQCVVDSAAFVADNPEVDPDIWERFRDGDGLPIIAGDAAPAIQGNARWLGLIAALDAELTGTDMLTAQRHTSGHAPPHPGAVRPGIGFPLSDGSELIVAPGGALMLVSVDGRRKAKWGQGEAARIERDIKAMLGNFSTDITAPRDYSTNLSSFFGSKRGGSRR